MKIRTIPGTLAAAMLLAASLHAATIDESADSTPDAKRPDFSVGSVAGGINLYETTTTGIKLVKGSPFVPDFVVPELPYNIANPQPIDLFMDRNREYVYALYDYGNEPVRILFSFKVTPKGLEEVDHTDVEGYQQKYTPTQSNFFATHDFLHYSQSRPTYNGVGVLNTEYLLRLAQGHFKGPIYPDGPADAQFDPSYALVIDKADRFLYVCNPSPDPLYVYDLHQLIKATDGTLTAKYVATSTDPAYIAAQCSFSYYQ